MARRSQNLEAKTRVEILAPGRVELVDKGEESSFEYSGLLHTI